MDRSCFPEIQKEAADRELQHHVAEAMANWRKNILPQVACPAAQLRSIHDPIIN